MLYTPVLICGSSPRTVYRRYALGIKPGINLSSIFSPLTISVPYVGTTSFRIHASMREINIIIRYDEYYYYRHYTVHTSRYFRVIGKFAIGDAHMIELVFEYAFEFERKTFLFQRQQITQFTNTNADRSDYLWNATETTNIFTRLKVRTTLLYRLTDNRHNAVFTKVTDPRLT